MKVDEKGVVVRTVPVEDLGKIAAFWVGQEWPMTEPEVENACRVLGWEQDEEGFFLLPYELSDRTVSIVSGSDLSVGTIDFRVTDVVHDPSVERDAFMNDVFVDAVEAFKKNWGKPRFRRKLEAEDAVWDLPNGGILQISNDRRGVLFVTHSPSYAKVIRRLGVRG
ncbi:DUF6301 family protein [Arachnia propionica]|uniref:Uncharacterized protein n=1 Tax=Arachnia propionica TaxID=1750 RepID=A0A3P1WWB1_9ACTN|nr:DUF6301 family protein [Arachnia propionica]RRD50892.1 hypothetical protein EII35_02250 [Arachnia propionica]